MEKKQERAIKIPELEPFRPPPVFNMNIVQQPIMSGYGGYVSPLIPRPENKKIVVENYDELRIKND